MKKSKTKVMMENDTPIYVNNTQIENVESYIYLSNQHQRQNQDKENQISITSGWTAFVKHRDIFEGNIGTCLKRQVYNSCVLPAMTHGAETWTLTTQAKNKLAATQTKLERSSYVKYHMHPDRKTNIWVRKKTNVTDVMEQVRRRK